MWNYLRASSVRVLACDSVVAPDGVEALGFRECGEKTAISFRNSSIVPPATKS